MKLLLYILDVFKIVYSFFPYAIKDKNVARVEKHKIKVWPWMVEFASFLKSTLFGTLEGKIFFLTRLFYSYFDTKYENLFRYLLK